MSPSIPSQAARSAPAPHSPSGTDDSAPPTRKELTQSSPRSRNVSHPALQPRSVGLSHADTTDLGACHPPRRGPLPDGYEVVRHQRPSGETVRVMGQRDSWGRFHAKDAAGQVHATLKAIPLEDAGMVWMEGIHAGLQGGHPEHLAMATQMLSTIRRNHYHRNNFKSDNKCHTRVDEDTENDRIWNAKAEIDKVQEQGHSPLGVRGHNCGQLTEIAKAYGQANGWPVHGVGSGPTGELHGFAIVGPRPQRLPDDFTQWPADLAICDVWANIACNARDYPGQFQAKMRKWASEGKEIYDGDQEDWVKATDAAWVNAVLRGPKTLD